MPELPNTVLVTAADVRNYTGMGKAKLDAWLSLHPEVLWQANGARNGRPRTKRLLKRAVLLKALET